MVITRSDSLKTATAANVFAYAIETEHKQKTTGLITETKNTKNENESTPRNITDETHTNVAYKSEDDLRKQLGYRQEKALSSYAGFDLRHSCYLSILV